MTSNDKKMAEELFGTLQPLQKMGDFKPDIKAIRGIIVEKPTFIHGGFCSGCGLKRAFTNKGVKSLSGYYETPLPADPEQETLLVLFDGCQFCDTDFKNARFYKLDDYEKSLTE